MILRINELKVGSEVPSARRKSLKSMLDVRINSRTIREPSGDTLDRSRAAKPSTYLDDVTQNKKTRETD